MPSLLMSLFSETPKTCFQIHSHRSKSRELSDRYIIELGHPNKHWHVGSIDFGLWVMSDGNQEIQKTPN